MLFSLSTTHSTHLCLLLALAVAVVTGKPSNISPWISKAYHRRTTSLPTSFRGGEHTTQSSSSTSSNTTKLQLLQVQIIHRHGDRTPVTPMKDVDYWHSTLPKREVLHRISQGTRLKRHDEEEGMRHDAGGKQPFGQMTTLGLLQMVQLGSKLRDELSHIADELEDTDALDESSSDTTTSTSSIAQHKLFTLDKPLHPQRIKVRSTDFPRTIQSVQALLVGLFPDGFAPHLLEDDDSFIEIDVRHSKFHIPDPQPRNSKQQEELERQLALREHLMEKEYEMLPLAVKVTKELQELIHEQEAKKISTGFNVGGVHKDDQLNDHVVEESIRPLPWGQLTEITKCLRVRNLLPPGVTHEEQDLISQHTSWRWFEAFRHPKLGKLAMHTMMIDLLHNAEEAIQKGEDEGAPLLHIYSGHDSTLIGLMCAFRLEKPAEWPEYASYLKIELFAMKIEAEEEDSVTEDRGDAKTLNGGKVEHYVRFSLNGTLLRSALGCDENGEPRDMVPLDLLKRFIHESHLDEELDTTETI